MKRLVLALASACFLLLVAAESNHVHVKPQKTPCAFCALAGQAVPQVPALPPAARAVAAVWQPLQPACNAAPIASAVLPASARDPPAA
ncbi:MAG: hypothetical protein KGO96_04645 [Elusimicrobia bacterium]|nr:hypothetical protein [Elusimicrobiota bacterium]MDE2425179.1 hypothetical protein [Elusimicrobiota bacterium]